MNFIFAIVLFLAGPVFAQDRDCPDALTSKHPAVDAISKGDYFAFQRAIADSNEILHDLWKEIALVRTISNGHIEMAIMLIKDGVNANSKDKDNETALMWASFNGYAKVARLLIEAGAKVNLKNKDGDTALIWASFAGHPEVVRLLIEAGAKVNIKNKDGDTALTWAAHKYHTDIVNLLNEATAKQDRKPSIFRNIIDFITKR